MKNSLIKIDENIKDKLLSPFSEDSEIKNSISKLREGDKLTNVFYYFIDNDKSLGERAKEVYFNGLIWSSLADFIVISPLAIIVYLIAFFITNNMQYMIFIAVCVGMCLLSIFLLMPLLVKKHINLSNYQLTYIIEKSKKELHDQLIALL